MFDEAELKTRYRRDAIPIRLGNLASSVKRLGYLIFSNKSQAVVSMLFRECRLFIEWTAPDAGLEIKTALETLQCELAAWQNSFLTMTGNEFRRAEINAACEQWANRILELSGLLKTGRSGVAQT